MCLIFLVWKHWVSVGWNYSESNFGSIFLVSLGHTDSRWFISPKIRDQSNIWADQLQLLPTKPPHPDVCLRRLQTARGKPSAPRSHCGNFLCKIMLSSRINTMFGFIVWVMFRDQLSVTFWTRWTMEVVWKHKLSCI